MEEGRKGRSDREKEGGGRESVAVNIITVYISYHIISCLNFLFYF